MSTFHCRVLFNHASMDKEVNSLIWKASVPFGKLTKRVWIKKGINFPAKLKISKEIVLIAVPNGCEP